MKENGEKTPLVDPRLVRLGSVFTPAAPIQNEDLFSGRNDLLVRIAHAVSQRGMHCILFGERGVGKTSLANILPSTLASSGAELVVAAINCDTSDDYSSLMHKLMQEIIAVTEMPNIGFGRDFTEIQSPLSQSLPESPRPNDVRRLLQAVGANVLLIIDEFDRIVDQDLLRLISDTIKTLSDRAVPATFVLVGVASNVDGLLREHRSIERCLMQVRMPRMTSDELAGIIDNGLEQVDMAMEDTVRWYIPAVAQGYPHYAHLLALESAWRSVKEDRKEVNLNDIESSIGDAINHTEHSIQDGYLKAVYSANRTALYEQVLLACALADTDNLNFFSAQAVQGPLSRILGSNREIPAFARHLDAFCKEERGPTLVKEGQTRRYRYRFAVPLLRPYVLLQGIAKGLISADILR